MRTKTTEADVGTTKEHQDRDPLLVQSVAKAFRVLSAFDGTHATLSLSQIAEETGLDMSAAQRFSHTLTKLGYLKKGSSTKRLELTVKTLDFGYHYTKSSSLVERGLPYLLHLSKETEETVNLTVLDHTEVVIVSRVMSRHVLNNDVVVGTRLPAFCMASGVALLSALPTAEAHNILEQSELRAYTPNTTFDIAALKAKIATSARQGYATAFEEYFHGDLSIAAPVFDSVKGPIGAINIAVTRSRFTAAEAEERFAPLVMAAAQSISLVSGTKRRP